MPKNVLYFAENALSPIQGGGIVAYATLRDLPPEHLLGFYTYTNITPALEYAHRFHALQTLGEGAIDGNALLPPYPHSVHGRSKLRRVVHGSRDKLRTLIAPMLTWRSRSDWRRVHDRVRKEAFRPELVFTAPLSLRMLQLAVKAANAYSLPLVMLNMDDWIAQESSRVAPLSGLWQRRVAAVMAAAKPRVLYAYSNSARLAGRLSQRYGIPHATMNNASADLMTGRPTWQAPPARKGTLITFAGALNWHLQGQTLLRVAEAVTELRLDREIELRVFAPWEFAPLANLMNVPGAVTYAGFRAPGELVDSYLESDFLLATTTFLEEHIHLFRHSLATKLSDYLCVGRPVLSVGHPDWAVHDYVEEHGCGLAVRVPDRIEIRRQLLKAVAIDAAERERIGRSNRRLWEQAHDVRVMAAELREIVGLGGPT